MNLVRPLTRFLWRGFFFAWRQLCRLATRFRHPLLAGKPALLLRYETVAQKQAYLGACLQPPLEGVRNKRILVIMPFRDKWALTQRALEALLHQELAGAILLVAMVDNGSEESSTVNGIANTLNRAVPGITFRHLRYEIPFNFSRLNNRAVEDCSDFAPDHVLFLNNDVELTQADTIVTLAAFLEANRTCGSVGCTLLYPNRKIQHLFIFLGCKIVGAHPFKGHTYSAHDPWMRSPRPVGAATAALLLCRAPIFRELGGFNEALPNFQDVDLALKLQAHGTVNWVLPGVVAVHHETQSRAHAFDRNEITMLQAIWGVALRDNRYISPRFSRWSEQLVFSLGEGPFPWHKTISSAPACIRPDRPSFPRRGGRED